MTGKQDQNPTVRESGPDDSDTTTAYPSDGRPQISKSSGSQYQPLEPGSILGRYEVIECLDNGGMGVVYRARHTALGKLVALKVVATMLQSDPRAMDRFLREMQAIGRIEPHPNVLNAYDAGDEDGVQYIATELIEGIQLASLVGTIGPLSVSEACKIISQAALALDHLRKHDLVHRDIKPSNLMLTRDGTVKVVDMGLALLRDEQAEQITMSGEAMGSIDYMAPEQWRDSHNVDWRSDVYSLGCTFYCLLAGRAPYSEHHKGSVSRMRAHLEAEFPDIREKRSDVPTEALKLLQAMIAKDPDRRLTDLAELSNKLDLIAAGDLKGLVERGFAKTGDKRGQAVPRTSNRVKPRSLGGSIDVDAATQPDFSAGLGAEPELTSAVEIPRSTLARRTGVAAAVIGAILALLAVAHFSKTDNPQGFLSAEIPTEATEPESIPSDPTRDQRNRSGPAPATRSLPSLAEPVTLVGHQSKIMDMVFLDPQAKIASISDDGILCIFDLQEPSKPLHTAKVSNRAAAAIVYDPAADELTIACEDGAFHIHSPQDAQVIRSEQLSGVGFTGLAHAPEQNAYLTSDWNGEVRRIDLSAKPAVNRLISSRREVVYDVDISRDGSLIAWVGRESAVTLFNVDNQSKTDLSGHTHWVYDVAISPDGARMASAGHEGVVRIWRLPSGELEFEIEQVVPQALCFLPDNQLLAVGGRGSTVKIWDLDSNREIKELPLGRPVDCIAVSADSQLLAVGGNDGTLKVWTLSLTP